MNKYRNLDRCILNKEWSSYHDFFCKGHLGMKFLRSKRILHLNTGFNGASMIKRPIIIFEHFFEIQATVHWTRNRRQIMKKLVLRLCMRHEHRWKQVRWLFILHVYNVEIKVVKLDILPMYVVCACFSCSVHTCWKESWILDRILQTFFH